MEKENLKDISALLEINEDMTPLSEEEIQKMRKRREKAKEEIMDKRPKRKRNRKLSYIED